MEPSKGRSKDIEGFWEPDLMPAVTAILSPIAKAPESAGLHISAVAAIHVVASHADPPARTKMAVSEKPVESHVAIQSAGREGLVSLKSQF